MARTHIALQGKIEVISAYDPPNLYNTDGNLQRRAVAALLRSPQNNLRMHVDGVPASTREVCASMRFSAPEAHAASEPVTESHVENQLIDVIVVRPRHGVGSRRHGTFAPIGPATAGE